MTLYGIDIAQFQAGESLAEVKREGFTWVEARASTGYPAKDGGSADPDFASFKTQAKTLGLPFVGYHYLYAHATVPIARQVQVCAASVGDRSIPVMVDHETADGTGMPSIADAVAFAEGMRAAGFRVPLWYLPHWLWSGLGSPALPKSAGMTLVASGYVAGKGYASSLYPGTPWPSYAQPYGGLTPAIWQFTDQALVAGKYVDADAFEGTAAELAALLNTGGGDDMALTAADVKMLLDTEVETLSGQKVTLLRLLQGSNDNSWEALETAQAVAKAVGGLSAQLATLEQKVAALEAASGSYQVTGSLNIAQPASS